MAASRLIHRYCRIPKTRTYQPEAQAREAAKLRRRVPRLRFGLVTPLHVFGANPRACSRVPAAVLNRGDAVPALDSLGWSASWAKVYAAHAPPNCLPGRVAVEHRELYEVLTEDGEVSAPVSGRLRHEAR